MGSNSSISSPDRLAPGARSLNETVAQPASLSEQLKPRPCIDARGLFVDNYRLLRELLQQHPEPGLLIAAFEPGRSLGYCCWSRATIGKTRPILIGRHPACDLVIEHCHAEISLRHLAVLVRAISLDEVRVRVLDLRTTDGFSDEQGRALRAVMTEGSLFLRIGKVVLALLVTGDPGWPLSARDAYDMIPERVFFEERLRLVGGCTTHGLVARAGAVANSTLIRARHGVLGMTGRLLSDDDEIAGTLSLSTPDQQSMLPVGKRALDRGILIGRYARCDLGCSSLTSSQLSRVHLLIVRDGDDILVIDTASTFGTTCHGQPFRRARLTGGATFVLGEALTLGWSIRS